MDDFWDTSDYFTGPALTHDAVRSAEKLLGYKLPEAYVRLLRVRNGGSPRKPYFPIVGLAGWDRGYFEVTSLRGIGHEDWSIDTNDMGDNYPAIGLSICDTPSGGHDAVMLDYSLCGPQGQPRVVHAEQGCTASQVTLLAPDFETFVAALSDHRPRRARQ